MSDAPNFVLIPDDPHYRVYQAVVRNANKLFQEFLLALQSEDEEAQKRALFAMRRYILDHDLRIGEDIVIGANPASDDGAPSQLTDPNTTAD